MNSYNELDEQRTSASRSWARRNFSLCIKIVKLFYSTPCRFLEPHGKENRQPERDTTMTGPCQVEHGNGIPGRPRRAATQIAQRTHIRSKANVGIFDKTIAPALGWAWGGLTLLIVRPSRQRLSAS
jgi:hypothetical protein